MIVMRLFRYVLLGVMFCLMSCWMSVGSLQAALPYDVALGKKVTAYPELPQAVSRCFTDGADTRETSITAKAAGWISAPDDTMTSFVIDLDQPTSNIIGVTVNCFATTATQPVSLPAKEMTAYCSYDGKNWQLFGKLHPDTLLPTDYSNRITEWAVSGNASADTQFVKVEIDWGKETQGAKLLTEVRVLTIPPTVKMRGTFFFIENKEKWPRERFAKELDWMNDVGMDSMILMRMVRDNLAFYPTKLDGYKVLTETDPFDYILDEASKRNMSIYLHLGDASDYWSKDDDAEYYDKLAQKIIAVADDAYARYAKYPALKGFYLIPEFWYPVSESVQRVWIDHYLKPVTKHLKSLDAKYQICSAPFVEPEPYFKSNDYEAFWHKIFEEVPFLYFIAVQDGIGANEYPNSDSKARTYSYMQEIFYRTQCACASTSRTLWCDLESFEKVYTPFPQHFSRFIDQMYSAAPIVGNKIMTFEWAYLSPSHSASSVLYYQNAQRYLAGTPLLDILSRDCPVSLSKSGSSRKFVKDNDLAKLTDGGQEEATSVTGVKLTNPTVLTVDLCRVHPDIEAFAVNFANESTCSAEWPESIEVEVSVDGKKYQSVGKFGAPYNEDVNISNTGYFRPENMCEARYVSFLIKPRQGKTAYPSELAVLGVGQMIRSRLCPYKLSHLPGDRFPDPNGKLTNGEHTIRGYAQVGWYDQKSTVSVELDLGAIGPVCDIEAYFLRKDKEPGDARVALPEKAEIQLSDEGTTWSSPVALVAPKISTDRTNHCYRTSFNRSGRYVRLTIYPSKDPETWLNINELRVYGK